MKERRLICSLFALLCYVGFSGAVYGQNTNPTAVQGPNGEVPAPDKHPTPPLTFPPSSACAFHGKPDCEEKIRQDALENAKFGKTGVKGGGPATSTGEAFGSNAQPGVQPIGGFSSGISSTLPPSAPSAGISGTNPNSIGNSSAGTPSPSGTGNGAPHLPSSSSGGMSGSEGSSSGGL
jgi:hypothetical protein